MAAPQVNLNDWVQVNAIGRVHGQTTIYTHLYRYWSNTQPGTELDLAQIAEHFLDRWWTGAAPKYKPAHASTFEMKSVTAQVIAPVRSIAWPWVTNAIEAPGEVLEPALPSGVAVVIRRRGNLGDRHNYGRIYLSGVPATFVQNSVLTNAAKDAYNVIAADQEDDQLVEATGGSATLRPHILNKTNIPLSRVVTHGMLDDIVRYQRRREVGVGI